MNNYFQGFNYSLANEDNFLEINLAKSLKSKNILTIAGSGNRSLFLSSIKPDNLTIIDTSKKQLDYCKYKERLVKTNNLEQYWQVLSEGPLYLGNYEQTLIKYSKIIKLIVGKKHLEKLCSFNSIEEQQEYYRNFILRTKLRLALRLVGNPFVMNLLLYKGNFVKKNISLGHGEYYVKRFEEIIERFLLKDNFFTQLIFLGHINSSSAIICENDPQIFTQAKEWLEYKKPNYICTPINQIKPSDLNKKIDFLSYSNVPSYYSGELEIKHMQMLKPILQEGAVIVIRYYLREPKITNFDGFDDVTHLYNDLIKQEKVNMYEIKVFKLVTNDTQGIS